MKSKKTYAVILFSLMTLISLNVFGQKFYLSLDGGYGFDALNNVIANNETMGSNQAITGSFGSGFNFGGLVGYKISKNINVELSGSYLIGNTIDYSGIGGVDIVIYNGTTITIPSCDHKYRGSMFRIIPGIKITMDSAKIIPYIRGGIVIGISPKFTYYENGYFAYPLITFENTISTTEYSGGTTIGGMAAIGLDYSFNKHLGIFTEVNFIAQSWAPNQSAITQYTLNNIDNLQNLPVIEKQTNYVNSLSSSTGTVYYSNQPKQALKQYYPFSSWGFNVGVTYHFGKQ